MNTYRIVSRKALCTSPNIHVIEKLYLWHVHKLIAWAKFPISQNTVSVHTTGETIYKFSCQARYYCCRKTAVCIRDQLLNFSLPELVRSQSTFSPDPEVLQNSAGFTLCSSAGLAVGQCSAVMGLAPWVLCVQIYCVLCVLDYYLLNYQLWIQDWIGLCFRNFYVCWVLLRVWLPQLSTYIDYLNFQPQSSTFSKKLT